MVAPESSGVGGPASKGWNAAEWRRRYEMRSGVAESFSLGGWWDECGRPPGEVALDLACVDLMRRRRSGDPAAVEDYLTLLTELDRDGRLDLIDAEICVRRELGEQPSTAGWRRRFPDEAGSIDQLLEMDKPCSAFGSGSRVDASLICDSRVAALPAAGPRDRSDDGSSAGFSFDGSLAVVDQPDVPAAHTLMSIEGQGRNEGGGPPIRGGKLYASRPGYWTMRGTVDGRDGLMVMRLVERPAAMTAEEFVRRSTDLRESLSDIVGHPGWVEIAMVAGDAVQAAVVRPWISGLNWSDWFASKRSAVDAAVIESLFDVAHAVGSATAVGRVHGGVHPRNVVRDHGGRWRLVDAGVGGLATTAAASETSGDRSDWLAWTAATLSRSDDPDHRRRLVGVLAAADGGAGVVELAEVLKKPPVQAPALFSFWKSQRA